MYKCYFSTTKSHDIIHFELKILYFCNMLQFPWQLILFTNDILGCMIHDNMVQNLFCFIINISHFVECIISEQISHYVLNPPKEFLFDSRNVWLDLVSGSILTSIKPPLILVGQNQSFFPCAFPDGYLYLNLILILL